MLGRIVCAISSVLAFATSAQAADFLPNRACSAVEQPNSGRIIGALQPGTSYRLLKTGGPGNQWCKLALPEGPAWILCAEGSQRSGEPNAQPTAKSGNAKSGPAFASPIAGDPFDYYLLSLSWSPSFCASRESGEPEQCGIDKHYGFVVHGLWPQRESGDNPMSCSVGAGGESLDESLVNKQLDLMPSRKLIHHEWQKHGTCSGLSPSDYFAKARAAYAAIHIPRELQRPAQPVSATLQQIQSLFLTANQGLLPSMMAVQCRRSVSEIRFCLDKDLRPRACGQRVGNNCAGTVFFPPLR